MIDEVKKIAEKFYQDENLSQQKALLIGSLGLQRQSGLIAGLTYDVQLSGHPYNEERQNLLTEYLGEVLLNWHLLAMAAGVNADEIGKRFAATWEAKRAGNTQTQASIKDLLKHLKPNVKQQDNAQTQQVESKTAAPERTDQL